MRRLLVWVAIAFAVASCTPKVANASPPKPGPFAFVLHRGALSAPDTLVGTFACTAAAPTTACGVTVSATGGAIDPANTSTSVNVGQSGTVAIVCTAPGASVTFTGSLFGTASGYTNSAPTATVTQNLTCPTRAAATPGSFVITFTVHAGG